MHLHRAWFLDDRTSRISNTTLVMFIPNFTATLLLKAAYLSTLLSQYTHTHTRTHICDSILGNRPCSHQYTEIHFSSVTYQS